MLWRVDDTSRIAESELDGDWCSPHPCRQLPQGKWLKFYHRHSPFAIELCSWSFASAQLVIAGNNFVLTYSKSTPFYRIGSRSLAIPHVVGLARVSQDDLFDLSILGQRQLRDKTQKSRYCKSGKLPLTKRYEFFGR